MFRFEGASRHICSAEVGHFAAREQLYMRSDEGPQCLSLTSGTTTFCKCVIFIPTIDRSVRLQGTITLGLGAQPWVLSGLTAAQLTVLRRNHTGSSMAVVAHLTASMAWSRSYKRRKLETNHLPVW